MKRFFLKYWVGGIQNSHTGYQSDVLEDMQSHAEGLAQLFSEDLSVLVVLDREVAPPAFVSAYLSDRTEALVDRVMKEVAL